MMHARHDVDFYWDICRHCGVSHKALVEGSASRFCTHISGSLPLWPPLVLGAVVTLIMLKGIIYG